MWSQKIPGKAPAGATIYYTHSNCKTFSFSANFYINVEIEL